MQDREPTYPGRVTLTPVYGLANTYDMERADQPLQEGTPINKANLLKDATAALFGKTNAAVPDDILSLLSKSMMAQTAGKYTETTTIGTLAIGSTITVNVNGTPTKFLVVHQGKPSNLYDDSCDGTWLLMKDVYENRVWNSDNVNKYETSDINSYLNSTFLNLFGSNIKNAIKQVKIPYRKNGGTGGTDQSGANGLPCKIFLLSGKEVGLTLSNYNILPVDGAKLSYFEDGEGLSANNKRTATLDGSPTYWWLRTMYKTDTYTVFMIAGDGSNKGAPANSSYGIRPALILPSTFEVYFDSSGNGYTEQEYETKITDVLGNLIAIPADQIKDGVKIATGSYTGTGTYGSSNPNSLTFDFEPKVLFIAPITNQSGPLNFQSVFWKGMTSFPTYIGSADTGMSVVVSWGTTVSWYTNGSYANRQLNDSGTSYAYIAIG